MHLLTVRSIARSGSLIMMYLGTDITFSKIWALLCFLILTVFQNLPPHCQSECEEDGHVVDGHREVDVEEHEESPEH